MHPWYRVDKKHYGHYSSKNIRGLFRALAYAMRFAEHGYTVSVWRSTPGRVLRIWASWDGEC